MSTRSQQRGIIVGRRRLVVWRSRKTAECIHWMQGRILDLPADYPFHGLIDHTARPQWVYLKQSADGRQWVIRHGKWMGAKEVSRECSP